MELTIDQSTLQETLELVGRVSTKHVSLPVLQCVLITATEGTVTFRATNLETGIEVERNVEVTEIGNMAVPAQTLLQTVQLISQKTVTLKQEEQSLLVEAGRSVTRINSIPHDEFPTIPQVVGDEQTLNRQLFTVGIKTAAFAASQSSIKPELGSINIIQKKEHSLTFVATDSFRLMEKSVPQKGVVFDGSLLLPQKNALEFARVCDTLTDDPTLTVGEDQCALRFASSGVYITSRVVNGSFPDYQQIIPKEYCTHVTVLKSDLAALYKKTNIFLNRFNQVTLTITPEGLTASANNGEVGTTTESIKAQVEGDELSLNFNQRYLIDPLQYIQDESVILHFAGIGRPMVMTGVTDSSFRYLVMPMNK